MLVAMSATQMSPSKMEFKVRIKINIVERWCELACGYWIVYSNGVSHRIIKGEYDNGLSE